MHIDPVVVGFGLGVGTLIGMTGVGAGSLMTPILILVIGVKPITAIGSDLAYGAITNSVGGWRHWRQRTVDVSLSTWMALGSLPAAIAGVIVLKLLEHGDRESIDDTLLITLGAVLMMCAVAMLARLLLGEATARERDRVPLTPRLRITAVALGLAIGFIVGVTSAGSGSLITVAMILAFGLAPRQVVGSSVFNSAIVLWAAALAHVVAGDVDYGLAGTILIGSVPGVWLGSALSYRVPVGALRVSLALLILGASMALLQKAGAGIPTVALAAFPLGVGALFLIAAMRSRNRVTPAELRSLDRPAAPPMRETSRTRLAAEISAGGRD
ncbi:MAG TPA: sulfite exporter TauE/SafE family protein [Solirubrobacteraceae bacterium]